jgi:hypothetical protein
MSTYAQNERAYCTKLYKAASGNWDIFCVFIEKALSLTRQHGLASLIVPNKLGSASYATGARRVLACECRLISLRDFSSVPVFPVAVYPIIFLATQERPCKTDEVVYERMVVKKSGNIDVGEAAQLAYDDYFGNADQGWPVFSQLNGVHLVAKLNSKFPRLDKIATIVGAATVAEAYLISPMLHDDSKGTGFRFANSGTIDRYAFLWGISDCRYLKQSYRYPRLSISDLNNISKKRASQARTPKIIISGMTKVLECGIDMRGEFVPGKSTSVVFFNGDLRYLAALMNSRLTSFYYDTVFGGNKLAGGYLRIGPPQLSTIPIVEIDFKNVHERVTHDKLVALVEKMLTLHQQLAAAKTPQDTTLLQRQIAATDKQIDQLVYALYGLTDEEIALVEKT